MIENIEVFIQNSIRIASRQGTIYIDPFRMKEQRHDADYILITHDHYDHFSPEDIEKVSKPDSILIVPEKMAHKARKAAGNISRMETVKPGEKYEVNGLMFETVSAYNILKPFHPRSAEWVGYVLGIDGRRVYIAGDTDVTKEAKAVKCEVALVPIGGTYTMDAKKAAELVNVIRPEIAIPVHYGELVGKPSDGQIFEKYVKEPVQVVFKI